MAIDQVVGVWGKEVSPREVGTEILKEVVLLFCKILYRFHASESPPRGVETSFALGSAEADGVAQAVHSC